ncbi:MAG TPA: pyridoxal-phosphate dependent enzyme [Gaiellales bacterium]|nr:pyridoxal-phosphate dependent enzyme [Gaiellales bacterium]
MPAPTAFECLRCRRRYPVVQMPGGCPSCSAEDCPSNVAPIYARMQGIKPGKLSGDGLHRYAAQLPVARERLVSLGEGSTPLVSVGALGRELGLRRLFVKDERRNPTGSWRDRFAAVAVSQHLDADVTVGSAGGEAMSMSVAAYAARAGMRSVALVDAALEEGGRVLDAIEWVGGRAVGVAGAEARWALLADAERQLGWRAISNRTRPPIGSDPIGIEGYRTIAYEIAEQLRWSVPDLVAVPAALGDGIQGIWRGFRDLADWGTVDATPRMVAVEVGGAVASSLAGGRDWVTPSGEVSSLARSLAGITGTVQTLQAVVESEGLVVRVTDAELEAGRILLGETEGIWAELGAAAGVAAAQKLASRGDIPARAQFVAVVTEHGLLDEAAQTPAVLETVDARVDELLRVLAVRGE